jgi:hypothetical protein
VAREINESTRREGERLSGMQASMSAFGGSRGALMESENLEKGRQGISDLYKTGFAEAFDFATNTWAGERARDLQASGQYQDLATAMQNINQTDIASLMATGGTDRMIVQAMMDFDYSQFIENRDWDIRNLGGLLAALEGTQGSYSTTTTGVTKESGSTLGQVLGVAAMVVGSFYGKPPVPA